MVALLLSARQFREIANSGVRILGIVGSSFRDRQLCTDVSNREFPSGFDAFSMGKYAATFIHKKGLEKQEATADQQQEAIKIARGFQFVLMLPNHASGVVVVDRD